MLDAINAFRPEGGFTYILASLVIMPRLGPAAGYKGVRVGLGPCWALTPALWWRSAALEIGYGGHFVTSTCLRPCWLQDIG